MTEQEKHINRASGCLLSIISILLVIAVHALVPQVERQFVLGLLGIDLLGFISYSYAAVKAGRAQREEMDI